MIKDNEIFDVAIVGAGPAGAFSAYLLARRGLRVLLIERAIFPRDKVCGCCMNTSALRALGAEGLGDLVKNAGAVPLRNARLAANGVIAEIPLTGGAALSRRQFDAALVHAAVEHGARFLDGTCARSGEGRGGESRQLLLIRGGRTQSVNARVILACDGVRGNLLDAETGAEWRIARYGRIGVSTILPRSLRCCESGTIHMAIGQGGYVGLVRLEDGRVNLAAALDPDECRKSGGPAALINRIFDAAGFAAITGCAVARFRATPLLTRNRAVPGGWRALAVGDAAGYIEPFTGEGIAWALTSARAVVPLVLGGLDRWSCDTIRQWRNTQHRLLGLRRAVCRSLTLGLRRPRLTAVSLRTLIGLERLTARLFGPKIILRWLIGPEIS